MTKGLRRLVIACAALALVLAAVLVRISRQIDVTLLAVEYRLDDPDYAVERTITVQGRDTRNLLGRGTFEGTVAVSGLETAGEDWTAYVTFPPDSHLNITFDRFGSFEHSAVKELYTLLADRNWTEVLILLAEEWDSENGAHHASFDFQTGRFLVSGAPDRAKALDLAASLTRGTVLSSIFSEP